MNKKYRNALLAVSLAVAVLAAAEIGCRLAETDEERAYFDNNPLMYEHFDPELGWANRPSTHGVMNVKYAARPVHIHINSDGMRNHELLPKDRFRIAVLGDSFAWGYGVEADERFTEGVAGKYPADVLNFGVPGYGPTQYYLELDRVLSFKPDMVILTFCLGNDFTDTVAKNGPYATLENDQLVIKGVPVIDASLLKEPLRPLLGTSALARKLYRLLAPHVRDQEVSSVKGLRLNTIYRDPDSSQAQQAFAVTEAVIQAIRTKLRERHIPMVILQARTKRDLHNDNAAKLLATLAEDTHMHVIDAGDTEPDDHLKDPLGNWSSQGHEKAKHALFQAVERFMGPAANP